MLELIGLYGGRLIVTFSAGELHVSVGDDAACAEIVLTCSSHAHRD